MPHNEIERVEVKRWFRYKLNTENPSESTFSCRICEDYHKEAGVSTNHLGPLTGSRGQSISNYARNYKTIHNHHEKGVHVAIGNYLKNQEKSKILQGFQMAEARSSEKECEKYEITRIMFRLIYTEVKLNIPLYHHTDLIKLFKMANVNIGFHHYERRSAQRIVDHISFEMRTDLIKGIKHSPAPVSILTDGATDQTQNH